VLEPTRSAASAALILCLTGPSLYAQAPVDLTTIGPGQLLASAEAGLTFTVPAGFSGAWESDAGGFVFQSATPAVGSVWGWSQGAVEEVVTHLGTVLGELGIELSPRGDPSATAAGVRGTFHAVTAEGTGLLVAQVENGPAGNVLAVAALGAVAAEADLNLFVDDVFKTVQWATPGASQWPRLLQGNVMNWSSSDSNMSTGGGGTATGASQSLASISFCSGQYRYTESSESYFSIEGLSASNNSSDEHSGDWALISDFVGNPTLYLDSTDGRSFAWSIVEDANGWMIDGYLYRPGGRC